MKPTIIRGLASLMIFEILYSSPASAQPPMPSDMYLLDEVATQWQWNEQNRLLFQCNEGVDSCLALACEQIHLENKGTEPELVLAITDRHYMASAVQIWTLRGDKFADNSTYAPKFSPKLSQFFQMSTVFVPFENLVSKDGAYPDRFAFSFPNGFDGEQYKIHVHRALNEFDIRDMYEVCGTWSMAESNAPNQPADAVPRSQETQSAQPDIAPSSELSCSGPVVESTINQIIRRQLDRDAILISGRADGVEQRTQMLSRIVYSLSNIRTRSSNAPLECAAQLRLNKPDVSGLPIEGANGVTIIYQMLSATGRSEVNIRYKVENTDGGDVWVEILN